MRAFTAVFCVFVLGILAVAAIVVCATVRASQAEDIVPWFGVAAIPFFVLLFRLMWHSARPSGAHDNSAARVSGGEEEAIRELVRVQNRIEQRVTNLETILLHRVHDSVRTDQY